MKSVYGVDVRPPSAGDVLLFRRYSGASKSPVVGVGVDAKSLQVYADYVNMGRCGFPPKPSPADAQLYRRYASC